MSSSPSPPSHSRCHPRRRPHLTVDVTPAIAAFEQSMSSPPSLSSNSRCRPHRRHLLAVDVVPTVVAFEQSISSPPSPPSNGWCHRLRAAIAVDAFIQSMLSPRCAVVIVSALHINAFPVIIFVVEPPDALVLLQPVSQKLPASVSALRACDCCVLHCLPFLTISHSVGRVRDMGSSRIKPRGRALQRLLWTPSEYPVIR